MPDMLPNETARQRALAMSVVMGFASAEANYQVQDGRWAEVLANGIAEMNGGGDAASGVFVLKATIFEALVFRGVAGTDAQAALSGDDAAAARVRDRLRSDLPSTPRQSNDVIEAFARAGL